MYKHPYLYTYMYKHPHLYTYTYTQVCIHTIHLNTLITNLLILGFTGVTNICSPPLKISN